ncbi:MAG: hypothetical protein IRY91_06155 [Gemmatimonadaceae bacterium]|nr:hypothetical protein [Gemmatimonadaceae bacterium]
MEASAVSLAGSRSSVRAQTLAAPWPIFSVLFASACVIIGVMWDISWHTTIGRDTFWTPAHMAIYLGGIVAGLACGWLALHTTFAGTPEERAQGVRFWRFFTAPLGAWVCIWGTFAMLTSAPFDDWWHNAYGLDVKILSPPHTVLALGIGAIQLGALLMTLARQNRAVEEGAARARYDRLYAVAAGLIFLNSTIMTSEFAYRVLMHSPRFYEVTCGVFTFYLVTLARAARLRWPTTTIAAVYTGVVIAMVWILPLFPAESRLGPIYQPVTHMVPPDFPLLVIAPAVVMDLIFQRYGERFGGWRLAALLGAAFFVVFLAVQWNFAEFLNSPYSQNWVFATNNYFYGLPKNTYMYRHLFRPSPPMLPWRWLIPLALAIVAARLGLAVGGWFRRVQR